MSFYDAIAANYDYIFPLRQGRVDFVKSLIPKETKAVVDLGCATGGLALSLAKEEIVVTAIDLNEAMVEDGRRRAIRGGVAVNFLVTDMCKVADLLPKQSVGGAFCFGNTLVHLPDHETITQFIGSVHSVLRPASPFVGQIVNYDKIMARRLDGLPTIDNEHIRFERDYRYGEAGDRIVFAARLTDKKSGQTSAEEVLLYPIVKEQLTASFKTAGFERIDYYSDYNCGDWSIEKTPTFFVAWK